MSQKRLTGHDRFWQGKNNRIHQVRLINCFDGTLSFAVGCWGGGDDFSHRTCKNSSQIVITNKPTSDFLQAGCHSCRPSNSVGALKGKVGCCSAKCKTCYKIWQKSAHLLTEVMTRNQHSLQGGGFSQFHDGFSKLHSVNPCNVLLCIHCW